ncbi:hypothetical protein [Gimesia algae]|uniref:Uncharacterized protein n=1 Tax=Gimesia algae TaxID=2527971 RepID=A0A517VAY3_9PLAN|nr:hypothetical protein [Gimesia algae]QDT90167.1 hypothetical protein Pan161_18170 [Gimesia algae]
MTQFWKEGHYRTNAQGNEFWVNGHYVNRDDWNRSSYDYMPPPPQVDSFLIQYPEFKTESRVSVCFVTPNALCPVCGESVYYYQNKNGSRVFFDELGHPWPKHPCTDSSTTAARTSISLSQSSGIFDFRSNRDITAISKWQKRRGNDIAAKFKEKYGTNPCPLAIIIKRIKNGNQVFVFLKMYQEGRARKVYLSCKSLPKCCQTGFLVAVQKQKISFVNTATMTPVEVSIRRYRGAAAFLDAMIEN